MDEDRLILAAQRIMLAKRALVDTVNHLLAEGMAGPTVAQALALTAAAMIEEQRGAGEVPNWFRSQARIVTALRTAKPIGEARS